MITKKIDLNADGVILKGILDLPDNYESEKHPLLLILHGFTGSKDEKHIEAVAHAAVEEGYCALRYDQYGHGESGGTFKDHNVMIWLYEAMKVIEMASKYEFVSDIVVAGHSQGGLNTILVGGMMNDVVKAIIPMAAAANIIDYAKRDNMFGIDFAGKEKPECVTFGPRSLSLNYLRTAKMINMDVAVEQFDRPVLLIHGTGDTTVPYSYSEELSKQYKNCKLVSLDGDNHSFNLHLDKAVNAVKQFLREVK